MEHLYRKKKSLKKQKKRLLDTLHVYSKLLADAKLPAKEVRINQHLAKKVENEIDDIDEKLDVLMQQMKTLQDSNFLYDAIDAYKERLFNIKRFANVELHKEVYVPNYKLNKEWYVNRMEPTTPHMNYFPRKNFGGESFWQHCTLEYGTLKNNRILFENFKTDNPLLQLCIWLLKDRVRLCKDGMKIHLQIYNGGHVTQFKRKEIGNPIMCNYRIMTYVLKSKLWLSTMLAVEKNVDNCLKIKKQAAVKRSWKYEEELKHAPYWMAAELLLDFFEKVTHSYKAAMPTSFYCPLPKHTPGKVLRNQLKMYYSRTAFELSDKEKPEKIQKEMHVLASKLEQKAIQNQKYFFGMF